MVKSRDPFNTESGATHLEILFAQHVKDAGLPEPEFQYSIYPDEGDFDFVWVLERIAVEIDGGIWMASKGEGKRSGGHAHPSKIVKANAKRNRARADDWIVFQFDTNAVNDGSGIELLKRFFERRKNRGPSFIENVGI